MKVKKSDFTFVKSSEPQGIVAISVADAICMVKGLWAKKSDSGLPGSSEPAGHCATSIANTFCTTNKLRQFV